MPRAQDGPDDAARSRVLLVDDRPENLLALEAVLEPLGAALVRAASAEEALAAVDAQDFAVILLDVQMPGTDGLEAARRIKARERGRIVPIVFMTALDTDRRRVTTAYQAGAVDYLFKPFDPDELRAKVASFLALDRMQAEDRERRRRYADRLVHSGEERYRRAAEEAERARALAEAADRAKADFLARMSHEFRTPLNAILGYVQLLDLGVLGAVTGEQHAHLHRVHVSAVHLLGLVNEILDFVTVDAVDVDAARQSGRVGDACEAALALIPPEAAARALTVDAEGAIGRRAHLRRRRHRVRQILLHLLGNAVKFTAPGGRVLLDATRSTAPTRPRRAGEGAGTYVSVADTGRGIASEQMSTIFEPFTQVDGSSTRAPAARGSGSRSPAAGARDGRRRPRAQRAVAGLDVHAVAPCGAAGSAARGGRAVGGDGSAPRARAGGAAQRARLPTRRGDRRTLLGDVEVVTRHHVARMRADATLPHVGTLNDAQARDHVATIVCEIAQVLVIVGETGDRGRELLRDGSEILQLVAELHGAQRHRLGWDEADFAREAAMLREEMDAALRRAARAAPGEDLALREATRITHRVLEQACQTSLRGFRVARKAHVM